MPDRTAPLFVGLLVGVILIVGGLTFFPALALGPIVEHLAMLAGTRSEQRQPHEDPIHAAAVHQERKRMPVTSMLDPAILLPACPTPSASSTRGT